MNSKASNRGYTILEVLIFLTVSGFILVGALVSVNGRQEQIQFQQGVRDLDSQISAAINDVSGGYFPSSGLACSDPGGVNLVVTSTASDSQGKNEDCVFAGKAIVFPGASTDNNITLTTVAAMRPELGRSTTLANAKLTPLNGGVVNLDEVKNTSWGLRVINVSDQAGNDVRYIAYLSGFGQESATSNSLESGGQSISLVKSGLPLDSISIRSAATVDSSDAIYICLESRDGNKRAAIILGENGRQLTSTVDQDAEGKYAQCDF